MEVALHKDVALHEMEVALHKNILRQLHNWPSSQLRWTRGTLQYKTPCSFLCYYDVVLHKMKVALHKILYGDYMADHHDWRRFCVELEGHCSTKLLAQLSLFWCGAARIGSSATEKYFVTSTQLSSQLGWARGALQYKAPRSTFSVLMWRYTKCK